MKLWIAALTAFLVLMWFVLLLGYTECNRGGCGAGYPIAVGTFYATGAVLSALIVLSLVRWISRRRDKTARTDATS